MHLIKFVNLEGKGIYINREYVVAVMVREDHTAIEMEGDFAIRTINHRRSIQAE